MKKTFYLILAIVAIYLIYLEFRTPNTIKNQGDSVATTTPDGVTATSSIDISGLKPGQKIEVAPGVFGEVVDISDAPTSSTTIPSLDKPIVFPKDSLLEVNKKIEAEIKNLITLLKKNPNSFNNWIQLGVYRKSIEDYDGAREVWEYAVDLRPNEPLPYSNLGNLYGYYLKDTMKAEENYLTSIKKGMSNGFWYYQTFLFYKEVMKDNIKAKNIVEEGIKNNPNDEDLKNILKTL